MSDIIVAILHFPNDQTHNNAAHQLFIAEQTGSYLNLYSVSSILGKERLDQLCAKELKIRLQK